MAICAGCSFVLDCIYKECVLRRRQRGDTVLVFFVETVTESGFAAIFLD